VTQSFPANFAALGISVGGHVTTVDTLTNLPAIPAGWLTAAGIAAAALNGKGDWSTYSGGDTSGTTTLLARVPGTVQPQTGDSFLRLGAPAGASISADLAEIEAETDGIALIPTNPYTGTPPTATQNAAAVLDVAASGHNISGSVGAKINTAGSAADPLSNLLGAYASNTAGGALQKIAGAANIVVQSFITPGGTISLVAGDSYFADDDRAIPWTDSTNVLPDLTGATALFLVENGFSSPVTITNPAGPVKILFTELSSANTTLLGSGKSYTYKLWVTLVDGHSFTAFPGIIGLT
jgi:hypothetical protein